MIAPFFMASAEQVIEDRRSNLVSLVNITEVLSTIVVQPEQPEESSAPVILGRPLDLKILAVWQREPDDDPSILYESEFRVAWPGQEPKTVRSAEFQFGKGVYFRNLLNMFGAPGKPQSGVLVIECRARKKGDERWVTQSVRIPVQVVSRDIDEPAAEG